MLDDGGQTFAGARPTAGRPSLSRPMEARRLCCPSMCQHQVPSATAEAFCPPALRLSARRRLSQQRRLVSQLAVENSGLSSGNKGAWNMRLRVGMGGDRVADGLVQGADGCPDAPHELDLDPDELFNNGLAEAGSRPGRGAHALDHDAARALSGVALPLAPAFQPPGGELGGRGRVGYRSRNARAMSLPNGCCRTDFERCASNGSLDRYDRDHTGRAGEAGSARHGQPHPAPFAGMVLTAAVNSSLVGAATGSSRAHSGRSPSKIRYR